LGAEQKKKISHQKSSIFLINKIKYYAPKYFNHGYNKGKPTPLGPIIVEKQGGAKKEFPPKSTFSKSRIVRKFIIIF